MPKAKPLPSAEELRALFDYNAVTGILRWKARGIPKFDCYFPGREAGTPTATGHKQIRLKGWSALSAHRVVWKMAHGSIPNDMEIDHIDGNPRNNRLENLRLVTSAENKRNARIGRKNTSGVLGVRWMNSTNKWKAYIGDPKAPDHLLGYFKAFGDAVDARKAAEFARGYHPNHGRVA
jgi:hypothetical protein